MIVGIIVVVVGLGGVVSAIVWTLTQSLARRARERADTVVANEHLVSLGAWSVNLLGATSLQRTSIRGVGVLVITKTRVEFRLGYGSTAITIPRATITTVEVGRTFTMRGKVRRYRRPIVLTMHWRVDDTECFAGFATRQAETIAARLR